LSAVGLANMMSKERPLMIRLLLVDFSETPLINVT
jgi:hypothetical protein